MIAAAERECVAEKMLAGADDAASDVIGLQSPNIRDAHSPAELRRFTIGFFDATPARIARDIEYRREVMSRAHC